MAVVWGGESGHMSVGIDVFTDGYDTNTPSINVYVDVYVRCGASWNFNDSQTVTLSGSVGGQWTFQNTLSSNQTRYIGRAQINGQGQSYGGGPGYYFEARISGHYQGATPAVGVNFSLPARPANIPTQPGISISNVSSSSANVNVSAADGRGAGIDAYETEVATDSGFGNVIWRVGGGSGTITGLGPSSTFYARTRAHNAVGWGAYSGTASFTTGANPPAQVTTLAFASGNIGQTTAVATWSAPNNGGSAIGSYDLQISTSSSFSTIAKQLNLVAGQWSPYTVTDLVPGTQYYARMRANNGVGSGSYSPTVAFATLAGTPAIISPIQSGTDTNGIADFTIEALGISSISRITIEVSQDSTFASIFATLNATPGSASSSNRYQVTSTGTYLKTGTWYARAKVTNTSSGYVTPWSATRTWVESHAPSASIVSPTAGVFVKYAASPLFVWNFNDSAGSYDNMTAYQLIIENNATGAVVFDSGKTALTTSPGQNQVSVAVPLASTYKNVGLRWKVLVYDKGDTASPFTGYALFTLADTPTVIVTTPASAIPVDNGAPTFAWTASFPSGGSQASAVVTVFKSSDNSKVWEGAVTGSAQTSITPPIVILENAGSYYFTLKVTDSTGLSTTVTSNFTTSYNAPASVNYTTDNSNVDNLGYILVDWTNANPDDLFARWKVYRRTGTGPWELKATIGNQNERYFRDYMIVAGEIYSYSVTQVATRSGILLESTVGYYANATGSTFPETRTYTAELSYYWILNPDDPSLSVRLINVTSDPSTLEYEQETYTIIGRGRHTDYGDRLGYSGTIECQIRQPMRRSEFRDRVEALRDAQETYYYRTPFGRLYKISLGNIGWTPMGGTGLMEMGDMSIPYNEVN